MVNVADTSKIMEFDKIRIDQRMRELAYSNCDHRPRCFQLCWKDKECLNRAVVYAHWQLMAHHN